MAAGLAARARADDAACLACHAEKVDGDAFAASAHTGFGCTGCHADIEDFPHPEHPAVPDCARCHDDVVREHGTSVHATTPCAGCHGDPHRIRPASDAASAVNRARLAETCARCHRDGAPGAVAGLPVVRPVEAYLKSVHARAVDHGGATCADCHGAHGVRRVADPASPLARPAVAAVCGRCHQAERAAWDDGIHAEALAHGVRDAPSCTDCHGEHAILARAEPSSPVFAANIPRETCGRCHGSIRLNAKYGLEAARVTTFEDSFHGLALRSGQLTAANCASCHGAHDVRPSRDPRSRVAPARLAETCGRCHPGIGTRVALGPVHVLATTGSARAVGWIRFVYVWVIGLVVGGMFVHNVLDLAMKARRPERPRPTATSAPERMPRAFRWQHGLVMASFPVLVYSGFALTYPERWWAAPLLAWETQLGLRGLVHRTAAVVLLAALAWHVGLLAMRPDLRERFAGFVPRRRDLTDVAGTFAYYLGLRARPPHPGEYGYVEKAEYWAFMWGTALMALTGFVLWFENVTLRWLPKWVTDVATAIHFWEAVLATLAILVWHLYWVVFDPDVYPMDASWWHGRPPAARVLERSEAEEPREGS